MVPHDVPLPRFCDLPWHPDRQQVRHVLLEWPIWPRHEEEALALTAIEKEAFGSSEYGQQERVLNWNGKVPTLLHSIAHHFEPCPCGCRLPFHDGTLKARGLHAVLVQSKHPDLGLRHLHPKEAAMMIGASAGLQYDHPRKVLPLLGQIASPVQSHWMLSQLKAAKDHLPFQTVVNNHNRLMDWLIQQHRLGMAFESMYIPRTLTILFEDEAGFDVVVTEPLTFEQFQTSTTQLLHESYAVDFAQLPLGLGKKHPLPLDVTMIPLKRTGCGAMDFELIEQLLTTPQTPGLDDLTMFREGTKLLHKYRQRFPERQELCFIPPRTLTLLSELPRCDLQLHLKHYVKESQLILSFLWDEGHWLFVEIQVLPECLTFIVWDGLLREFPTALTTLAPIWQEILQCDSLKTVVNCEVEQNGGFHCGTVALLHMGLCLQLWTKSDEATATMWYDHLKRQQMRLGTGSTREQAIVQWLQEFLPSKGVPAAQAEQRARQAVKRLGISGLEQAIKQKDPWRALKSLGNALGKPFMWIQVAELEQHIQDRAASKFAADTRKPKSNKARKMDAAVDLTPESLEIIPGSFVDEDDLDVQMISCDEITPDSRGIAIISANKATGFLQENTNLSTDALALITIGEVAELPEERGDAVQWVANYRPTNEPIIVQGHLINLGDHKISKSKTWKRAHHSGF